MQSKRVLRQLLRSAFCLYKRSKICIHSNKFHGRLSGAQETFLLLSFFQISILRPPPLPLPQETTRKQLLQYCSSPILEAPFTYLNPHVLSGPDRFCRVRPGGIQQTDEPSQRPCPPTICRLCNPQGAEPPVTTLINVGITRFASCGVAQKVTDDLQ
jgi:hypothetical protein